MEATSLSRYWWLLVYGTMSSAPIAGGSKNTGRKRDQFWLWPESEGFADCAGGGGGALSLMPIPGASPGPEVLRRPHLSFSFFLLLLIHCPSASSLLCFFLPFSWRSIKSPWTLVDISNLHFPLKIKWTGHVSQGHFLVHPYWGVWKEVSVGINHSSGIGPLWGSHGVVVGAL